MQNQNSLPLWNKNFLNVCLSSFFIFTNFYLLTATLPIYVKNDLKSSATEISLVISLYILGTVLLRPFSGLWADKFGKRKMSLLFLTLFIICNLAYFGTTSIVPLLIVRFINGFGFAVSTTSTSALAMDWIPIKRKGEGIGYFGLFMSLAMVIGPALGLYLTNNFDYTIVLTVASLFAILSMLFSYFSNEKIDHTQIQNEKPEEYNGIYKYIEAKSLPVSFSGFLLAFAYSSMLSYIGLYCIELGFPEAAILFFITLALLIIIPRPIIGKLLDKRGPNALIFPGIFLFIFGLVLLSQANTVSIVILSASIIGLGYGAIFPAYQTLSISAASQKRAGTASATFFLLYDIGVGGGSFIFGLTSDSLGFRPTYVIAAGITLLSLITYILLVKPFRKKLK